MWKGGHCRVRLHITLRPRSTEGKMKDPRTHPNCSGPLLTRGFRNGLKVFWKLGLRVQMLLLVRSSMSQTGPNLSWRSSAQPGGFRTFRLYGYFNLKMGHAGHVLGTCIATKLLVVPLLLYLLITRFLADATKWNSMNLIESVHEKPYWQ